MKHIRVGRLAALLTHRHSFLFFNVLITYLLIASIVQMIPMIFNEENNVHRLEEILDATATMLVAYGVVLEERESLMRILGVTRDYLDDCVDHLCHDLGVLLLVIGLLVEVTVQLIKIPNSIVNTDGIEWLIFLSGAIFTTIASYVMICNCIKMIRPAASFQQETAPLTKH